MRHEDEKWIGPNEYMKTNELYEIPDEFMKTKEI